MSEVFVLAPFAIGLMLGVVWRRRWVLAFPVVVAAWALQPPWHGVEIEVPSWYVAIVSGAAAAAGTITGLLVMRRRSRTDSTS